jgi:hypothetical protein
MRKILYLIIGLCLLVSCSEESQQRNEALKNERIKLEQTIDSLKKQQFIVTTFNDSLFLLNKNIMENMESRERNDRLMKERKQLEVEVNGNRNINEQLKLQHKTLIEQINKDKFALAASNTIYIVKIKIHQTTYTLDLEEHIKNKINDIEFEIPVDKSYYDNCSIGQKVSDPGLKLGSLLVDGDFSKLNVKITGKRTVKRNY